MVYVRISITVHGTDLLCIVGVGGDTDIRYAQLGRLSVYMINDRVENVAFLLTCHH